MSVSSLPLPIMPIQLQQSTPHQSSATPSTKTSIKAKVHCLSDCLTSMFAQNKPPDMLSVDNQFQHSGVQREGSGDVR